MVIDGYYWENGDWTSKKIGFDQLSWIYLPESWHKTTQTPFWVWFLEPIEITPPLGVFDICMLNEKGWKLHQLLHLIWIQFTCHILSWLPCLMSHNVPDIDSSKFQGLRVSPCSNRRMLVLDAEVWPRTLEMLARRVSDGGAAAVSDVSFSTAIGACENGMQQHLALTLLWDAEAGDDMGMAGMAGQGWRQGYDGFMGVIKLQLCQLCQLVWFSEWSLKGTMS